MPAANTSTQEKTCHARPYVRSGPRAVLFITSPAEPTPLAAASVTSAHGAARACCKHPTNGLRGLPSRIWVWGWGHWAPRTWVSRTDLPTSTHAKQEGLPTATSQMASKNAPARQIQVAGPQSKKDYRPQRTGRARKGSKPSSCRVKQGRLAATNLHHATRGPRHATDAGSLWDAGPHPHTQTWNRGPAGRSEISGWGVGPRIP